MMKLATAFALVAALGCGGSKDKTSDKTDKMDDKTVAVQPKPIDDKTAPKPDDKMSAQPKPDDKTAPKPDEKAQGDLLPECAAWRDAITKLSSCDKLSAQTRDTLKQAYDTAAAGWTNVPAEGKAALAQACKAGVDTVKQAAATCGG